MFRPIPTIPSGSLLPLDFQQIPQFSTKNRILTRRFASFFEDSGALVLPLFTLKNLRGNKWGNKWGNNK